MILGRGRLKGDGAKNDEEVIHYLNALGNGRETGDTGDSDRN